MAHIKFQPPSRVAAGLYNSVVLSNKPPEGKETAAPVTVYSFGSNRNCLQAAEDRPVDKHSDDEAKAGPRFTSEPLCIDQFGHRNIVQVSCGGNHCAVLENRLGEEGGDVYVWGLGTAGRLGVERPKKPGDLHELLKQSLCSDEQIMKLMQDKTYVRLMTSTDVTKWSLHHPLRLKFTGVRVAQISCGTDYTLALSVNGQVFSWGVGSYGNLGTGLICDQWFPAHVEMPNDLQCCQVAAGTKHSMALSTHGTMFSWGHGANGRLGQGASCEASLCPGIIKLDGNPSFTWVAVGEANSASVDSLGQVWCWGAGSFGRCGLGEEADEMYPTLVNSLIGEDCTRVCLGVMHGLTLTARGNIWSWGGAAYTGHGEDDDIETARVLDDDFFGGDRILEIAAGRFHSIAVSSRGDVYTWGSGSMGRLGLGMLGEEFKMRDLPTPKKVELAAKVPLVGWREVAKNGNGTSQEQSSVGEQGSAFDGKFLDRAVASQIQQIACGGSHSVAIEKDGSCWIWGSGEFGQNGQPNGQDTLQPKIMTVMDTLNPNVRIKVKSIALGLEHSFLISANGDVYSWGKNHCGQLGHGNTEDISEPLAVAAMPKASTVAAGEDHSAATTLLGEIYAWGNAECGKTGHGSSVVRSTISFPKQIRLESRMKFTACGPTHTLAISTHGEMFTFGGGWFGRLGHGNMDNEYSPTKVKHVITEMDGEDMDAPRFTDASCGSFHTCMLDDKMQLWCCGRDSVVCEEDHVTKPLLFKHIREQGALGPVKVEFIGLATGSAHTLVLTKEGNLWTWGDNAKGQLGLGQKAPDKVGEPTQVHSRGWSPRQATDMKSGFLMAVSCGYAHSMALVDTGEIFAWGLQTGGRLALKNPVQGRTCPMPHKVEPSWKSYEKEEEDEPKNAEEAGEGEGTIQQI